MAVSHDIQVKITAAFSQYVESMNQATALTKELCTMLTAAGIPEQDMPSAARGVIKLLHGEAAS